MSATREELVAALEPFAAYADALKLSSTDGDDDRLLSVRGVYVTVGHLRRARAVLDAVAAERRDA